MLLERMRSFGSKLLLLVALTSATAVGLVCILLVLIDFVRLQQAAVYDLRTQAKMLGVHSAAPLFFSDPKAAAETLASLRAEPNVAAAAIFLPEGERFATYQRAHAPAPMFTPAPSEHDYRDGWLVLTQPIVHQDRHVGNLVLVYDMSQVYRRLRWAVVVSLATGALATGAALLVALRLERVLTRPVAQLAATARAIADTRDFSRRAPKTSEDELGQFTDVFNQMLGQIQTQNAELHRAREWFRAAVESAPSAMVMSDTAGRIVMVNEQAEQIFGYQREQMMGQPAEMLLPHRLRGQGLLTQPREAPADDGPELSARRRDGSEFPIQIGLSCIRSEEGQHVLAAILDITTRKQAEEQLKAWAQTLEQRVAERTALAEQRAAQLRLLASELAQAEQRERRRLAQTLHDHLQQLLVAARMKLAWLLPRLADHELQQSLRQVDDTLMRSIAASRTLTVELSPPILYDAGLAPALDWLARHVKETHQLDVEVHVDPAAEPDGEDLRSLLFQLVRELLFNVVKHAGADRAKVSMSLAADEQVQIVVEDKGSGFDVAQVTAVRGGAGISGGGFGLFSVRERLEHMGGQVEIESTPGKGTRVTLRAPLQRPPVVSGAAAPAARGPSAAEKSAGPRRPRRSEKIRVLLADDHKILRDGIASLLREQEDMEVVGEAADGQMAVDLARRLRPDLIIMDVTMPRLSGIEATRRILSEFPHVRVIGLSMHEASDMANAMRAAGAVAYLSKGGPSDVLLATIRQHAAAEPVAEGQRQ